MFFWQASNELFRWLFRWFWKKKDRSWGMTWGQFRSTVKCRPFFPKSKTVFVGILQFWEPPQVSQSTPSTPWFQSFPHLPTLGKRLAFRGLFCMTLPTMAVSKTGFFLWLQEIVCRYFKIHKDALDVPKNTMKSLYYIIYIYIIHYIILSACTKS